MVLYKRSSMASVIMRKSLVILLIFLFAIFIFVIRQVPNKLTALSMSCQCVPTRADSEDDGTRKVSKDELLTLFSSLWNSSDEQALIDPVVILKTVKFMIEEKDEDDPELIDFVRGLIIPPAFNKELNLKNKKKSDHSQYDAAGFIDNILNQRRNGFFIEAGAFGGEDLSNSLFFEIERNWTGKFTFPIIRKS